MQRRHCSSNSDGSTVSAANAGVVCAAMLW